MKAGVRAGGGFYMFLLKLVRGWRGDFCMWVLRVGAPWGLLAVQLAC